METIADDATIVEGKAKISFEKGKVFYNPVQEFNRDLSVAAISVYQGLANRPQGLAIAECLSATGLRSIRYGLEIDGVSKIVANDIDPSATQIICKNVRDNGLEGKIQVNTQDAKYHRWMLFSFFLHAFRASNCLFDVVDLDPYGSSSPFIDSAVQAIASGGTAPSSPFRTSLCHMHRHGSPVRHVSRNLLWQVWECAYKGGRMP